MGLLLNAKCRLSNHRVLVQKKKKRFPPNRKIGVQSAGKIGMVFTIDTDFFFYNFFDSEGNLFFFFFCAKTL